MSPLLANLFMHYAFDSWLAREYPGVWFERYADDAVVHCVTERQAREVLAALGDRMEQVGLRLHPDKTKIVYCKDNNRPRRYERTAFTFLGYTFRPRPARDCHGKTFLAFLPAISPQALKKISGQVRRWRLHRWVYHTFGEVARTINPVVAGWMQYYGRSTRRRCIASWRASTPTWCAGSATSTDGTTRPAPPAGSSRRSPPGIPASSALALGHYRLVSRVTRAR